MLPADAIDPGDIVIIDAAHLVGTRGISRTWTHLGVLLWHFYKPELPDLITSQTRFDFACISSLTKKHPLDPSCQVPLDHRAVGLKHPSAACVDFCVTLRPRLIAGKLCLPGISRTTGVKPVAATPTLQAILGLYRAYWEAEAARLNRPPSAR